MRWEEITESHDSAVYYHGTQASFDGAPNPSKTGTYGPGVYLTKSKKAALDYGGGEEQGAVAKAYQIAPGKLATDAQLSRACERAKTEGFVATKKFPRAAEILADAGFIGIKDGPIVVVFDKENVIPITSESASAGATGAASVATVVGGLGAGFNPNGDHGVYEPARKKKKPILLKR